MKMPMRKTLVAAVLPSLFTWSFIAFAAVDNNTCKTLADSNCLPQEEGAEKAQIEPKNSSMLKKADLAAAQQEPVKSSKGKGSTSTASAKALADSMEFQKRADELTRQNIINNSTQFNRLRGQLGQEPTGVGQ